MDSDEIWRAEAACQDTSPEIFYCIGNDPETHLEAKTICSSCPVQEECLEYAFRTNQKHGVWGGQTEEERKVSRRRWVAENTRRVMKNVG
jgi:WhiB family redox-sensing transcriptional regulator